MRVRTLISILLLAAAPAAARSDCSPCAGLAVDDVAAAAALVAAAPQLGEEELLYLRWPTGETAADAATREAVRAAGAVAWQSVSFATPPPRLDNLEQLESELERLAAAARGARAGERFQLLWPAAGERPPSAEYAFLIKRASVAVTGEATDAEVVSAPLPADPDYLRQLFGDDLAAYLDATALAPAGAEALTAAATELQLLDPGTDVVLDGPVVPAEPGAILAEAARAAQLGAGTTMFRAVTLDAGAIAVLKLLAREFAGDLALDPYSRPEGAAGAWSFVRGEDLGLRVVAEAPAGAESLLLRFPDRNLRRPALVDLETGEAVPQFLTRRTDDAYLVEIPAPQPVLLLALERPGAGEIQGLEGVEEALTVEDARQMPVEEILRRLQAFEDAQRRRISSYTATNTSHLRFQAGTGAQTVEATFRGPFFYRRDEGFDWVWQELLINGVRWRNKTIPEIPLIQPEKAATLPVEITFGKEYRYRLRGAATVEGRDCWVVEFEPAVAVEPGRSLYQGTLWVDRQLYARVRTRAVQLGLSEGEVLSNEETISFSPVDAAGDAAPWAATSYFLPLRLVGQQIWSILSATTVVERELLLTDVRINPRDYDHQRQAALDSEYTMVRDTEAGLRYLVYDEEAGERVVKEEIDRNRRFLVGGVFYDQAQEAPIPLAGMNWLWFDWKGTGTQANVFFAGALAQVAVTNPNFLGSRTDVGFDAFGLAIAGTDEVFRGDEELTGETIKVTNPNIDLKLGRPLGNFFKLDLQYQLGYQKYTRDDDTAVDFVAPSDNLNHTLRIAARYNRLGWRAQLRGSHTIRDDWEPWGLPGNPGYDPEHKEFSQWAVALGKTWHLPKFLKFGAELEYLDGSDLDRFSKYDFGFFSDVTVHGYQSGKVRAEEALAAHLTYGFDVGGVFRLDLVGDAAWATDTASGLDNELLAGVGLVGTVIGPWQTVINVDIGAAVDGPDDGFTAFLAVLKLFK
ncbi:MAG: hypothetical protein ACE5EG_00165 [Thermoanaerobaculia bacterium]